MAVAVKEMKKAPGRERPASRMDGSTVLNGLSNRKFGVNMWTVMMNGGGRGEGNGLRNPWNSMRGLIEGAIKAVPERKDEPKENEKKATNTAPSRREDEKPKIPVSVEGFRGVNMWIC